MRDHSSYGIILDSMTDEELIALSKKGYFIRVENGDRVFALWDSSCIRRV